MLQILLMILKILGILVLVILGMILAVVLTVLLVPVRYHGDVAFDGKPKGGVFVSWLWRFVVVRVDYDGDALKALVKVLWFRLFEQTLWPSEETGEAVDERTEDDFFAETPPSMADVSKTNGKEAEPAVSPKPKRKDPAAEPEKTRTESLRTAEKPVKTDGKPINPDEKRIRTAAKEETRSGEEKKPFIEIAGERIQSAGWKVIEKVRSIYTSLTGKYQAGQEKMDRVRSFLCDAENQNTIRLLWHQVLKLFKHIMPRKLSGRVKFGFDDPAATGQILTYISPFYGMYANSLTIEPVFDEKVMEGELHLKGYIRLGMLLWIVVRVFLNKNFRTLLKQFMKRSK